MPFLQNQAAFGPPAEAPFLEEPVELQAQAEAYQKMIKPTTLSSLDNVLGRKIKYLENIGDKEILEYAKAPYIQKYNELKDKINKSEIPSSEDIREIQNLKTQVQNDPYMKVIQETHDKGAEWLQNQVIKNTGLKGDDPDLNKQRFLADMQAFRKKQIETGNLSSEGMPLYTPIATQPITEEIMRTVNTLPEQQWTTYNKYWSQIGVAPENFERLKIQVGERKEDLIRAFAEGYIRNKPEFMSYLYQRAQNQLSPYINEKFLDDSIHPDIQGEEREILKDQQYEDVINTQMDREIQNKSNLATSYAYRHEKEDYDRIKSAEVEAGLGIPPTGPFIIPGLTDIEAKPQSFDAALEKIKSNDTGGFLNTVLNMLSPGYAAIKNAYTEIGKVGQKIDEKYGTGTFKNNLDATIKYNDTIYQTKLNIYKQAAVYNPSLFGLSIPDMIDHEISNSALNSIKNTYNMYENLSIPGAQNIIKATKSENKSDEEKIKAIQNYVSQWQKQGVNQEYLTAPASKAATQFIKDLSVKYFGAPSQNGLIKDFIPSGLAMERVLIDDKGQSYKGSDILGDNKTHTVQIVGSGTGANIYKDPNWQKARFGASKGLMRIGIDGKFFWMEGDELDKLYMYKESQLRLPDNYAGGIIEDESGNVLPVLQEQGKNESTIYYSSHKDLSTNQYIVTAKIVDKNNKIIKEYSQSAADPVDAYNMLRQ